MKTSLSSRVRTISSSSLLKDNLLKFWAMKISSLSIKFILGLPKERAMDHSKGFNIIHQVHPKATHTVGYRPWSLLQFKPFRQRTMSHQVYRKRPPKQRVRDHYKGLSPMLIERESRIIFLVRLLNKVLAKFLSDLTYSNEITPPFNNCFIAPCLKTYVSFYHYIQNWNWLSV